MSNIESVLHREPRLPAAAELAVQGARFPAWRPIDALCAEAERDYEGFWARLAREHRAAGRSRSRKVLDEANAPFYKWFDDGSSTPRTTASTATSSTACGDKTAIIFEADDGKVTQGHLHASCYARVCQLRQRR